MAVRKQIPAVEEKGMVAGDIGNVSGYVTGGFLEDGMDAPVDMEQTGGGEYPVYKSKSDKSKAFASAFASARKAGKKKFKWEGRSYTTELK